MMLRNLRLGLANVVPEPDGNVAVAISAGSSTGEGGEVTDCWIRIMAHGYDKQSVKLPPSAGAKIDALKAAIRAGRGMARVELSADTEVRAYDSFETRSGSRLPGGVAIKSSGFEILDEQDLMAD